MRITAWLRVIQVLNELFTDLPFSITNGKIGGISAHIPWTNFWNQEYVLEIDSLQLVLVPEQAKPRNGKLYYFQNKEEYVNDKETPDLFLSICFQRKSDSRNCFMYTCSMCYSIRLSFYFSQVCTRRFPYIIFVNTFRWRFPSSRKDSA